MTAQKYDGVIEAVHYNPNGQVAWVRTYLRRGATFSDYILLNRQTLIEHLKAGKRYVIGERVEFMSSTFQVSKTVRIHHHNGQDFLVSEDLQVGHDCLAGAPVI